MEEIVTIDGHQFKLTLDRPLTASERQQVIADIRKQTGCSTCGPRVANLGNDWQYGGIQNLADVCTTTIKSSGDSVTLSASPNGGVGPYHVRFWRKSAPGAYTELGTSRTVSEGSSTSYTIGLLDPDIAGAIGDTTAGVPTTDTTGTISDIEDGAAGFDANRIRVATTVWDSCGAGPQTCVTYCDVNLTCVAPTCNFVVS